MTPERIEELKASVNSMRSIKNKNSTSELVYFYMTSLRNGEWLFSEEASKVVGASVGPRISEIMKVPEVREHFICRGIPCPTTGEIVYEVKKDKAWPDVSFVLNSMRKLKEETTEQNKEKQKQLLPKPAGLLFS